MGSWELLGREGTWGSFGMYDKVAYYVNAMCNKLVADSQWNGYEDEVGFGGVGKLG